MLTNTSNIRITHTLSLMPCNDHVHGYDKRQRLGLMVSFVGKHSLSYFERSPDLKRLISLLVLLASPLMAVAQTVYIGDTLYVSMRAGPSVQYSAVHNALRTGTALELVGEEEDGYYRVRTESGKEGYIAKQYLLFEPPAMFKLKQAEEESIYLKERVTQLASELKNAQIELKEKTATLAKNNKNTAQLQDELDHIKAISSKSLELDKRNIELIQANEQLISQLQALQVDNQQLSDSSEQNWFLYGAGTLFLGLLVGLLAPVLRPNKKSSGWA